MHEASYLQQLLVSMGEKRETIVVYEDNSPCIDIASGTGVSQRSKHINIKYHYSRQAIFDGVIQVERKCTKDMAADALTKILPDASNAIHRATILGSSQR